MWVAQFEERSGFLLVLLAFVNPWPVIESLILDVICLEDSRSCLRFLNDIRRFFYILSCPFPYVFLIPLFGYPFWHGIKGGLL